jgi:hypothetical protein
VATEFSKWALRASLLPYLMKKVFGIGLAVYSLGFWLKWLGFVARASSLF